ncbi:MAG: hypothetical protein IKR83_03725 [Bacteroidales bacterium]|nr:hypothetical protein [Bacteroidales bacterium]
MTEEEFRLAKPEHLAMKSDEPSYKNRGIRFIDVIVEPGGRYRYDIVTTTGVSAKAITTHEINSMLGIGKDRGPRKGIVQSRHDNDLANRLKSYKNKFADFCLYIEHNESKWVKEGI